MNKTYEAPKKYYKTMKLYKQWLADEDNNILHMTVNEWFHELMFSIADNATDYTLYSRRCCKGVELEINGVKIPFYRWLDYRDVMCHVRNADLTTMKIAND